MAWDFVTRPELPNSMMDLYYFTSPHKQIFEDFNCKVIKVKDGDTIEVRWDERDFDFPVRLLDINAPEMSEQRGQEVKDWLVNRIEGEEVDILINKTNRVGKFGRLLGHVFHRGIDAGTEMINLGLVEAFGAKAGKIPKINKELNIEKWF